MKVIGRQYITEFKPIKLEITFETLSEVQAFYALFNMSSVTSALNQYGIKSGDIRDGMNEVTKDARNNDIYNDLCSILRRKL